LSEVKLAPSRWLWGRAQVQGVPPPSHASVTGVVQGVARMDGCRSGEERAHPAGSRVVGVDRSRRAGVGGSPMITTGVDYADVQGLVRFGFKRMKEASYALLRVRDPAAARAWLRAAPITSAVTIQPPPPTALQVAFTAPGLKSLGVPPSVLGGFSHEFLSGMTEESRSRRLGDVGCNAPVNWQWGTRADVPHLVVMFFAESGRLEKFMESTTGDLWAGAFDMLGCLYTGDLDGREPFGFADGISQPELDWEQHS